MSSSGVSSSSVAEMLEVAVIGDQFEGGLVADGVMSALAALFSAFPNTSYSQNVLRHSVEVAFVAGLVAEMLGMDADLARRCGLLHDIGKAADHELEGGHPKIGADLLKRYGESPEVIHAAVGHHDDLKVENPYTVLVSAAEQPYFSLLLIRQGWPAVLP